MLKQAFQQEAPGPFHSSIPDESVHVRFFIYIVQPCNPPSSRTGMVMVVGILMLVVGDCVDRVGLPLVALPVGWVWGRAWLHLMWNIHLYITLHHMVPVGRSGRADGWGEGQDLEASYLLRYGPVLESYIPQARRHLRRPDRPAVNGFAPTVHQAIVACSRAVAWQHALLGALQGRRRGVHANTITFNCLAKACSAGRAWGWGARLLRCARAQGLRCDAVSAMNAWSGWQAGESPCEVHISVVEYMPISQITCQQ